MEDIEEAIILEDDVKLPEDFNVDIPSDADFVYLYVHPDSKKYDNKGIQKGYKTYGTVAYYIKKSLAQEFITFFSKITTSVDDSISWYLEHYKKTYYCIDLVDTIGSLYFHKDSGIGSAIGQTDLYKENTGIPSFYIDQEDFLFYPCCDCKGNAFSFNNLVSEYILNNNKILGYSLDLKNSGFIKKNIDKIYIDTNTNLYIKKIKGKPSIFLTGGNKNEK